MVTPRRRFSPTELQGEIARQLADDPSISTREIARRLRAAGGRVANDRIRAAARLARAGLSADLQGVIDAGANTFATQRQYTIALREFGADVDARASRETPTHVAITYEGRADVIVTMYGNLLRDQSGWYRARGTVVQPLSAYDPDLITERIASNIRGQVSVAVGNGTEGGTDGIEVRIVRQDVRVVNAELRGNARRGR